MLIYKVLTVRLSAGHVDEELAAYLNSAAEDGWTLDALGEGVSSVLPGGARAVERTIVFVRDADLDTQTGRMLTEIGGIES